MFELLCHQRKESLCPLPRDSLPGVLRLAPVLAGSCWDMEESAAFSLSREKTNRHFFLSRVARATAISHCRVQAFLDVRLVQSIWIFFATRWLDGLSQPRPSFQCCETPVKQSEFTVDRRQRVYSAVIFSAHAHSLNYGTLLAVPSAGKERDDGTSKQSGIARIDDPTTAEIVWPTC